MRDPDSIYAWQHVNKYLNLCLKTEASRKHCRDVLKWYFEDIFKMLKKKYCKQYKSEFEDAMKQLNFGNKLQIMRNGGLPLNYSLIDVCISNDRILKQLFSMDYFQVYDLNEAIMENLINSIKKDQVCPNHMIMECVNQLCIDMLQCYNFFLWFER